MIAGIVAGGASRGQSVTDPHFSNVSLLLHCDGENNGKVIADSSPIGHAAYLRGAAVTSTADPKFGTAAAATGLVWNDHIEVANTQALDLAGGDFTLEAQILCQGVGAGGGCVMGRWLNGNNYNINCDFLVHIDTSRRVSFFIGGSAFTTVAQTPAGVLFNDGVMRHVAVTRAGGTVRIFIDGVQKASGTIDRNIGYNPSEPFRTGVWGDPAGARMQGRIDEIRVTKGVARYTSNFTPPNAPFPNS